jgi:hypothetical protein
MNEIKENRIKIDSFYVETRIHGCHCVKCEFNMARKITGGERGHHCEFKKIELDDDGICKRRRFIE